MHVEAISIGRGWALLDTGHAVPIVGYLDMDGDRTEREDEAVVWIAGDEKAGYCNGPMDIARKADVFTRFGPAIVH